MKEIYWTCITICLSVDECMAVRECVVSSHPPPCGVLKGIEEIVVALLSLYCPVHCDVTYITVMYRSV